MTAGIYTITNTSTGKVYVGSSRNCERRFSEHRSRLRRNAHINAKLQASWNKHGEDAFIFTIIASVLDVDQIEGLEQSVLDQADAVRTGYNLAPTAGNTAGWKAGPETRLRMSEAAKRRSNSAQIAAMRQANTGKRRPAHVVQAMQRGRIEKGLSDAARAQMSASAVARSRYSQDDRGRMSAMIQAGMTYRAVAAEFKTGHSAVMAYVKRWRSEHGV